MFYKRISDLHPLGKTIDGWKTITPIPIPNPGYHFNIRTGVTSITSNTKGDAFDVSSNTGLIPLDDAFNNKKIWYHTKQNSYNYNTAKNSEEIRDTTDESLNSEYYAKSLWFEVAVSKGNDERPTSDPESIKKYQSKRVNAYLLFTNIDEISAHEISADVISTKTIFISELTSIPYISANIINTKNIYANYDEISSLNVTSITADGISSDLGCIDNISGDNLFYHNAKFDNILVSGVADLTAEAAYWADVAEIYTADNEYLYGTLVKFGGKEEITLADDKANAVISEKPAITLNAGNKDVNALPIVLTGRSQVRTIHPVKKFDKIYLSEKPGIGSISSYKISSATMPIGIALEDKPYDEEGLVECILQLNFE